MHICCIIWWCQSQEYNTYANTQANTNAGGLCCSGTNGLLISWLRPIATRGERHNSFYVNHYIRAAHLVMFKISIHLHRSRPEKLNCHRNGRKLNSLPPWSNLNSQLTLFQNPQIFRTISSGHDIIHTPSPFSVRGLLWQWWLSYPLRASVKLYPITMHLNSKPE